MALPGQAPSSPVFLPSVATSAVHRPVVDPSRSVLKVAGAARPVIPLYLSICTPSLRAGDRSDEARHRDRARRRSARAYTSSPNVCGSAATDPANLGRATNSVRVASVDEDDRGLVDQGGHMHTCVLTDLAHVFRFQKCHAIAMA